MSQFINHADYEPELSNAIHAAWSPHRDVVDYDDCHQECMVFWYGAAGQRFVFEHRDEPRLVVHRAASACRPFIRNERLARTGSAMEDQSDYMPGLVRKLLPLVFGLIEHPAIDPSAPRTQGGDPAEGNKLATMVADIDSSLALLTQSDRDYILAVIEYGEDFEALCGEDEGTQREAKVEYASLIEQVVGELNWDLYDIFGDDDEDEDDYDCD